MKGRLLSIGLLFLHLIIYCLTIHAENIQNSSLFFARWETPQHPLNIARDCTLTLHLFYPLGYEINSILLRKELIHIQDETASCFQLIDMSIGDPEIHREGNRIALWIRISIRLNDASAYHIKPFKIYLDSGTKTTTFYTPLLSLQTYNPKVLDFNHHLIQKPLAFPIKGVMKLSFENETNLLYNKERINEIKHFEQSLYRDRLFPWKYFITFAALLAAYLGRKIFIPTIQFYFKSLENSLSYQEEELLLRKVKKQRALTINRYDLFYVSLSHLIKVFAEKTYSLSLIGKSTQEIIEEILGNKLIPEEMQRLLIEFFRFADLVKFANVIPTLAQCDDSLALIDKIRGKRL